MLKCVTAEAIIDLYSYCIKMSPIKERWHQAEINYTGLCPLSTITCPFLSPHFPPILSLPICIPTFSLKKLPCSPLTFYLISIFLSTFIFSFIFGVSALASFLPKNTQDWSPLGWTGWIFLQSKGLSRVFSNTTVQKHQFFSTQLSL